ncbi:uncharacterized protein LODBEIA_P06920 [Lodderomyces beijingensis]|uniref:Rhodanese domain-containing protein n=1 Tax=Lodderomyces beijingensis TaxID=1775926 RepID=A0ABP0ZFY4_9ASCO
MYTCAYRTLSHSSSCDLHLKKKEGQEDQNCTNFSSIDWRNTAFFKNKRKRGMTQSCESELLKKIEELEKENARLRSVGADHSTHTSDDDKIKVDGVFTLDEYKRYGRQMIVPQFGALESQKKLRSAKVLVVGAGGLGSPALQYLCGAGVGTIGIVDGDTVDTSNLHRQVIHSTASVGHYKCDSAKSWMEKLNPHVHVVTYPERMNSQNAFEIVQGYDLVLDCTDHPAIRYLINDVCVVLGKTIVSGSGLKAEGQLTVLNFENIGPCYRCFYPHAPNPNTVTSCSDGGVIGPAIGMVGVGMAMEALKVLTGAYTKETFSPFLISYSAFPHQHMRVFKMRNKQPACIACGHLPQEKKIQQRDIENGTVDYVAFCGKISLDPLDPVHRVSAKQYAEARKANRKHVLIDVRPKEQFEITRISGSINIEWDPIFRKLDSLEEAVPDEMEIKKSDDLYLICRYGNDSQLATSKLLGMGYLGAKDVIGGLDKWSDDVDQTIPKY